MECARRDASKVDLPDPFPPAIAEIGYVRSSRKGPNPRRRPVVRDTAVRVPQLLSDFIQLRLSLSMLE
jgi:hypothetical protein